MITPGQAFPPLKLHSLSGESTDLRALVGKRHSLVLFLQEPATVLLQSLEQRRTTLDWLQCSIIPVLGSGEVPAEPWPSAAFPPWISLPPLPEGLERGKAYLVSRTRSVFSVYSDLQSLDLDVLERDLMVWEARHC